MKIRFIEFQEEIYVVVGIGYYSDHYHPVAPLYFTAVPLRNRNVYGALLEAYSINIPVDQAIEITDKTRISMLMVLYGD